MYSKKAIAGEIQNRIEDAASCFKRAGYAPGVNGDLMSREEMEELREIARDIEKLALRWLTV